MPSATEMPRRGIDAIRAIDYTIVFARDMARMRDFYGRILRFPVTRELSPDWIDYGVGANVLALARPPRDSAALQLAFRVSRQAVDECAADLAMAAVPILSPPTDQPWGHRTLFFRDPDGNLLEVFADL